MSRIILNYAIFRINYSDIRSLDLILLEKNFALLQSMESRFFNTENRLEASELVIGRKYAKFEAIPYLLDYQ